MPTVLITGGTGLIGKALTHALLEKNYKIIILSRDTDHKKQGAPRNVAYAQWDIASGKIDKEAIQKADYIIHLAGAGIADKRWTKKRKQEIRDSRVKSAELIVKSLQETPNTVKAIISASAIGWYGADPVTPNPHPFTEDAPAAEDFLGSACLEWEMSWEPLAKQGMRVVKLRTAPVLSKEGGALAEFDKPLRFGIAPVLGSGRQTFSWIHIDDLVRLYTSAIENEDMRGSYNAVSPQPVSNKEFILQAARATKGRFYIPVYVPAFALKTLFGEVSSEVLKSITVSCDKVHYSGFTFLYPSLEAALSQLNKNAAEKEQARQALS